MSWIFLRKHKRKGKEGPNLDARNAVGPVQRFDPGHACNVSFAGTSPQPESGNKWTLHKATCRWVRYSGCSDQHPVSSRAANTGIYGRLVHGLLGEMALLIRCSVAPWLWFMPTPFAPRAPSTAPRPKGESMLGTSLHASQVNQNLGPSRSIRTASPYERHHRIAEWVPIGHLCGSVRVLLTSTKACDWASLHLLTCPTPGPQEERGISALFRGGVSGQTRMLPWGIAAPSSTEIPLTALHMRYIEKGTPEVR